MAGELDNQDSLGELFSRLVEDARAAAKAEVDLVKLRATTAVARYKAASIYFAAAGVLALAALIALLVGLIMTLTPAVGPGFATMIVIGAVLLLVAVLALVGRSKLRAEPAA